MKDERFSIAGKGLKLMFIGQLAALFSILPLVGGAASLAGAILVLAGLVSTRRADPGYNRALVLSCAAAVLAAAMVAAAAVGSLLGSGGIMGTLLLGAAVSACGFLMVYFVCTTTSRLLRDLGREEEAARGDLVWKLNALYCLTGIVIAAAVSAGASGFLNAVTKLVYLAVSGLYAVFLYKSHAIFLA